MVPKPDPQCPVRPGDPCSLCYPGADGPQNCGLVWQVMQDPELQELDAIVAANDQMALGGYPVLREAGLRIPDDIAVMGFDDSPFSETSEPPLTTMSQPMIELGAEMARQLIRLIEDRTAEPLTVLQARLVERGSV